jgi:hypothetical protein
MSALRAAGLAAAVALCACAGGGGGVEARPAERDGWLVYALRDLRFEAPAAWRATGDARRIALEAPGGGARLELTVADARFADEKACLSAAEGRLGERQGGLERARRHPTRLAGRPAQALEGDQGGWHVWAIAACDGGAQYRVFFTAATPATAEALDVWKTLLRNARFAEVSA